MRKNHNSDYDKNFVLYELDAFKEKISTIIDIKLDNEKINLMIDNVKLLLKFSQEGNIDENGALVGNLTRLHNYLLKIINKETKEYLTNINYIFPVPVIESNNSRSNEYDNQTEILDAI